MALLALLVAAGPAQAQQRCTAQSATPAETTASLESLAGMDLESLLNTKVYSSTKQSQRGAATPAVVTVVTADEIRARGYNSLADVLRIVPGFYDVWDLASHNVGVRGVNGGPRAGGNVIKLMIDNHPVDFRPTTENFFGEELIPIEAVERVEVIRGPASALYGANAFLGVVNVITRCGTGLPGLQATGHGVVVRGRVGGGAGLLLGGGLGGFSGLVAAKAMQVDRSGLRLAPGSPILDRVDSPVAGRGASHDDVTRPRSFFGKASVSALAGTVTASASLQEVDSAAEFQAPGVLTGGSRVGLLNQNYRLFYEKEFAGGLGLALGANYLAGATTPADRIDLGRDDFVLVRKVGVRGWGFSAEGRVPLGEAHTVTFGTDFQNEDHALPSYSRRYIRDVVGDDGSIIMRAGNEVAGEGAGETRRLQNLGVYGQGLASFSNGWGSVVGVRLDYQNVYGAALSVRGGFVYAPEERPVSLKLLYGSSYKAPSASQMYTRPLGPGDLRGNPGVRAQWAHTLEAAGATRLPAERGEIEVNLYATNISDRVEFVQRGLFQTAENTVTELVVGGELSARVVLTQALHLRAMAGAARTAWQKKASVGAVESVPNQLFPVFQLHLVGDYNIPLLDARLSAEGSWVSARNASQSNALERGRSYQLPGYLYAATALTWRRVLFGTRETYLAARLGNLFNHPWRDPGFGGVDVPAQGMTALLTLSQAM